MFDKKIHRYLNADLRKNKRVILMILKTILSQKIKLIEYIKIIFFLKFFLLIYCYQLSLF